MKYLEIDMTKDVQDLKITKTLLRETGDLNKWRGNAVAMDQRTQRC